MCLSYFTNLRLIAAIQGMSKQNPEKTMYIHGQTSNVSLLLRGQKEKYGI